MPGLPFPWFMLALCLMAAWPTAAQRIVWSRPLADSAGTEDLYAIRVDDSGNTLLTGEYSGMMPLGAAIPTKSLTHFDQFLLKLGPDGEPAWFCHWASANNPRGGRIRPMIATDSRGRIYVATWDGDGKSNPVYFFGPGMNALKGDTTGGGYFICQFSGQGKLNWSKFFSASTDYMEYVHLDALADGFIFSGQYQHAVRFQGSADSLRTEDTLACFKAGGKADGTGLWVAPFHADNTSLIRHPLFMAKAPNGGRYVDSANALELYDSAGALIRSTPTGVGGDFLPFSMCSAPDGAVFIYGNAAEGTRFSRSGLPDTVFGPPAYPGDYRMALLRFDARGNLRWLLPSVEDKDGAEHAAPFPVKAGPDGSVNILTNHLNQGWKRYDSTGRLVYSQPPNGDTLNYHSNLMDMDTRGRLIFAGSYILQDYDFLDHHYTHYPPILTTNGFVAAVDPVAPAPLIRRARPVASTKPFPRDALGRPHRRGSAPAFIPR
jgi:hypothetical protein